MSMQCWKSSLSPLKSTKLRAIIICSWLKPPDREDPDIQKIPPNITTQRQVKYTHCTFSRIPQIPQILKVQNKSIRNHNTIYYKFQETIQFNKKDSPSTTQNAKSRRNGLRPIFIHNVYVMGILSSCPWVMSMQCWETSIPVSLSTRLLAILFVLGLCHQTEKIYDMSPPKNRQHQRQVQLHTMHIFRILNIPRIFKTHNKNIEDGHHTIH